MSSSAHFVDLAIFVTFLIVTLLAGFVYRRPMRTIKDFALGGKDFSTFVLTATIVATWFGGGSLYYTLANTYSQGLYFLISLLGVPLGLLLVGQVLARRVGNFLHNVSVAEMMGDMYGETVRIISAISSIVKQIGPIAMQFQVIGRALALILGGQDEALTILAAAIVILYSAWGGIRAVTLTDVVQFFTFGTFIPILALIVWNDLQNPQQVTATLAHNPNFNLREVVGWNANFANTIALTLFYMLQGTDSAIFQRVPMAKNIKQVQKAFTYTAFIAPFILACIVWIGILLLAENPHLEPNKLINYLINKYTYVGFKGLLVSGIVALAMSTADSCINACAVLFANDLAVPLGIGTTKSIFSAQIFSLVVGILGLLLTFYETDLLSLLLLSGSFYLPIVGVPLLLAILGFRSSKRAVLISMASGFTAVLMWRIFLAHTAIDSVMPAALVSLLALLSSHYLLGEPGGWQQVAPDSTHSIARGARPSRLQTIKTFNLYHYLRNNLPEHEGLYGLLGFYALLATYSALYTIDITDVKAYQVVYESILYAGLLTTTAFVLFPLAPPALKSERWMAFLWPLGLGFLLFFMGTLLVIMSHFHLLQIMVLLANLLVAVLLLEWPLAFVLALGGGSIAVLSFNHYVDASLPWGELGLGEFRSLYGLLIFLSLLGALFNYKASYKQLGKKNEALKSRSEDHQADLLQVAAEKLAALRTLEYTQPQDLLTLTRELQELSLAAPAAERMQAIQMKLLPLVFQLQDIDIRAQDYLRLYMGELSIERWWSQVKTAVKKKGINNPLYLRSTTQHQTLICDPERITALLTKAILLIEASSRRPVNPLMKSIRAYHEAQGIQMPTKYRDPEEDLPIIVVLEDTKLNYPMFNILGNYKKQIPALRIVVTTEESVPKLYSSYTHFLAATALVTPRNIEELENLDNARTIRAHYGYSESDPDTLLYVLPIDLREVRPKDADQDYMELGYLPVRADDHFKNDFIDAQVQEQAFLAAVAAHSEVDLDRVKTALELIKWYHGAKKRRSGEPSYLHPLAVAKTVLEYDQDEVTILGALLHEMVKDTHIVLQHLETVFGQEIAEVVDLVTHLQSLGRSVYKVQLSPEEHFQALEQSGNKRAVYVKLADRMHNMRTINGHEDVAKRKLIAEETLDLFVPLAEKLGLQETVKEFRERCLVIINTQV